MQVFDFVNSLTAHKSSFLILTGVLHLILFAVRKSPTLTDKQAQNLDKVFSAILFPVGVLQLWSFATYTGDIMTGSRGLLSPWGATGTIFFGATMLFGGLSATMQVGRKVPWAMLLGAGSAIAGGGSLYHVATGAGIGTLPVLGASLFIGIILFVSVFLLSLPFTTMLRGWGNFAAYSYPTLLTSLCASVAGVISAIGLVII